MDVKNQTTVAASDAGTRTTDSIRGYTFDQFSVDILLQQLTRSGEIVPLTGKAFDLLLVLLANRQRVLSKDELMNLVWPKTLVSDNSLAQIISVLRRTLGDDLDHPHYIATIARRGYRFVGDVAELKHDRTAVGTESLVDERTVTAPVPVSAAEPAPVLVPTRDASRPTPQIIWMLVATVAFVGSVTLAIGYLAGSRSPVRAEPIWFTQDAPSGTRIVSTSALSPDGRHLAFVAQNDQTQQTQLWIRALNTTAATPASGSDGALLPFWSPDSETIAFFSDGKIKRIRLGANLPQTIAKTDEVPEGGSWSTNGTILFSVKRSGILSVFLTGGNVKPVTVLDQAAHEFAHRRPQFLPDGRHFLFDIDSTDPGHAGTYVASLDAMQRWRVTEQFATYASPGYLLLAGDGVLNAQRFDPVRLRSLPGMMTVAEQVSGSAVSASTNNRLAFQASTPTTRLRRYTRAGQMIGVVDGAIGLHAPVLSGDGRELLASGTGGRLGIWLVDLGRRAVTRFADGSTAALWSPDRGRIAFVANRGGSSSEIYTRPVSGTGETLLLRTETAATLMDWSPDGRFIVYVLADSGTKRDLWLLPTFGDTKPVPLLQTPADEIGARISPDGRWVAYASDESGSWEVYVQSFPSPGFRRVISSGGGGQPKWRADGRELFYLSPDYHMMAVDVALGETPEFGRPTSLFQVPVLGTVFGKITQYTPLADGQQFIIDTVDPMSRADAITVAINWNTTASSH